MVGSVCFGVHCIQYLRESICFEFVVVFGSCLSTTSESLVMATLGEKPVAAI